jgi:hypothetical protein
MRPIILFVLMLLPLTSLRALICDTRHAPVSSSAELTWREKTARKIITKQLRKHVRRGDRSGVWGADRSAENAIGAVAPPSTARAEGSFIFSALSVVLAVIGLVLPVGIGLVLLALPLVALIFAAITLAKIRKHPDRYAGRRWTLAALILSAAFYAILLILVVVIIVVTTP